MSFGGINTGRTLNMHPAGCEAPKAEPCLLFDHNSQTNISHVFEVAEAKLIRAFDLSPGEIITVEMVVGAGSGHLFEPMMINNKVISVAHPNNVMMIPIPGRYRLRLHGIIGEATVICEDVPCCSAQVINASNLFGGA